MKQELYSLMNKIQNWSWRQSTAENRHIAESTCWQWAVLCRT